jgi:hypothetical protein
MFWHKLGFFRFSDAYVSWFCGYLINRWSRVCISGSLSQPLEVISGMPQGSVLGPFLFNVFINDLCSSVYSCKLLIYADLKIFRVINSPHDCLLLKPHINSVSDWCIANSMRLNTAKMRVVAYTRKANFLSYNYQLCRVTITRTSNIKDLAVFFDSKLQFHSHVDYVFSECIKLLGPTCSITYSISSLECYMCYTSL